jgi:O-antigen ligase
MDSNRSRTPDFCSGILVALLALVPLAILPGTFFYFDVTPKIMLLLLGTAAGVIFCGFLPRAQTTLEMRWFHGLLAAQAAWLALCTFLSTDRWLSVTGAGWRRFGLVVQLALLIYAFLLSHGRLSPVLRTISASGGAAALSGIAQYFGWDPWLPKNAYHISTGIWAIVRPPGTLGHADYYGVYLLYVVFGGAALAVTEKSRAWRIVGAMSSCLGGIAVILSGARSAILGLLAGLAILALSKRKGLTIRRLGLPAALAAGAAGLIAVFYFSPFGVPLQNRVRWYRGDPYGGGRLTVWSDTLRMARGRIFTGFGLETYGAQFPRFESEGLASKFPDRYYESPHNIFLDGLASLGLPGAALLLAMAFLGFWCFQRVAGQERALARILFAGFAGALLADQFVAFTVPTALMFYAYLAILCSLASAAKKPAGANGMGNWILASKIVTIPVAAVLVLFAFSFSWADYWLARTRDSLDAGYLDQARQQYQSLQRWRLPGFDTDLWYSRALAAALQKAAGPPQSTEQQTRAAWDEAFQAAQRAARASEEPANANYNLAAFYASANDFANTERALRRSADWAPHWYKPHWMLAQVLREAGRLTEAETEARRAVELNGGEHAEVAQTWHDIRKRLHKSQ